MSLLAMLVVLTNGPLNIPPARWQAISVMVEAPGTHVEIAFDVKSGARVQASLMTAAQAVRFNRGRDPQPICASGFREHERMRCRVPEAGQHVLLIDNRIASRAPTLLNLSVELHPPVNVVVRELPPERKRLVIAVSLAFFGAIVLFSARQFLKHGGAG
jgi:hypothetical protein